jgi:adenylate cyclase
MADRFEYTTLAHRYTARFPVLTYVGTQMNFWIIANILLVTVFFLYSQMVSEAFKVPVGGPFGPMLLIAIMFGVVYGICLGLTGYYLDAFFKTRAVGGIILCKAILSVFLLAMLLLLLRYVLFDLLIAPSMYLPGVELNDRSWNYLFWLMLIYYFFMTLMISFINQVNKKYGPGVLVPLLLGRYRHPKEEERIFMFMDLKSSTSTAEKLGHLKYSAFIRDCFMDINEVLYPFRAQVYQYVGDEIVVMWPAAEGLRERFCLRFYFACKKQFESRAEYYRTSYGLLPGFKAGLHMGKVTAVEIGEIKKDIAYHGDTLNTTARIQSVCNDYQKDFLVSEHLVEKIGLDEGMKKEHLGMVLLKGKSEEVGIVSVEWIGL